jgi:hypothetical protein
MSRNAFEVSVFTLEAEHASAAAPETQEQPNQEHMPVS